MRTRFVGRSALEVSRLGLGTLTWGRDVQPPDARMLLRTFVKAGGTLIDTAPTYGDGLAERMLGSLMRHDVRRDELVLATKAGFHVEGRQEVLDTSARALLRDLEGSLVRLGTDHIDIWQVHAWGDVPLDETLTALDSAVASGKARFVGVCNYVGWQLATAATVQEAGGVVPLISAQNEYSLLARRAEMEVLPAAQYHNLGFFPWSPLGRGVLTGQYRGGVPDGSRGDSRHLAWFIQPYLQPRADAVVDAVAKAGSGLGLSTAQVALLWVRDAPGVTAPLLGARTADQLMPLLDVENETLPPPISEALDDITGGPKVPMTRANGSGIEAA